MRLVLKTLVECYLAFVHSSALRRTGDATQAAELTRAVFLVLARRASSLRKKTVPAGWLFHVTAVACRKLERMGRCAGFGVVGKAARPGVPIPKTHNHDANCHRHGYDHAVHQLLWPSNRTQERCSGAGSLPLQ
jgi:hypothetical protein